MCAVILPNIEVKIDNYEDYLEAMDKYSGYLNDEKELLLRITEVQNKIMETVEKIDNSSSDNNGINNNKLKEGLDKELEQLQKKLRVVETYKTIYGNRLGGSKYYDKKILLNNIKHLIKEKGLKLGDIERGSGNTVGYISRLLKEDNLSAPNFDFVITAASMLNVSIEELLYSNLEKYTETEKYIKEFIEKLAKDTNKDKIEWAYETPMDLKRIKITDGGVAEHRMMSAKTLSEIDPVSGYPKYYDVAFFDSDTYGTETSILTNFYNARLKNGIYVYVLPVNKGDDPCDSAIEVWMSSDYESNFLCSNKGDSYISDLIEILYNSILNYFKRPMIKKNIKQSMDAFMKDDMDDDPEWGMPMKMGDSDYYDY